jgi:hypothetical protein
VTSDMKVLYLAVFGLICGKSVVQCGICGARAMVIEFAS